MTQNEHRELHAMASNIREDRLRGLVFKLLGEVDVDDLDDPEPEDASDDRAVPVKRKR